MKQKISKWEIFKTSAVISGVICVFAILVITITLQNSNLSNRIAGTSYAYSGTDFLAINATNSYGDCATLGGTWTLATKTCNVTSTTTTTNKTILISNGVTLTGNGLLTINFTAGTSDSDPRQTAVVLIGAVPGHTPATSTADDLVINVAGYMNFGVVMEGNGTALSNTTISNPTESNILVARNASNFDLQSNTTSGGPVGIEVKHWASTGTIDDHNATSHTLYGIEMYGANNVDITNSSLTGNTVYGLYIHDAIWTVEYSPIFDQQGTSVTNTYGFVDGNTMTGNTSYDIAVDVTDVNAWTAAQSTSAANTYNTLYEINGTFPEAPLFPPGTYDTDTFDLTVTVNEYQAVTDDCSGTLDLQNPNEVSGNLRAQAADFYGVDSCTITIVHNDATTNFNVQYDKSAPLAMSDTGDNQTFADIQNASAVDCIIDTSGNTDEEEFGYRLENVVLESGVNIQSDSECSHFEGETFINVYYDGTVSAPATPPVAPNEHLFDIEYSEAGNDAIIKKTSGSAVCLGTDCQFDLEVAANVSWDTYADVTYASYDGSGGGSPFTTRVTTTVEP